MNRPLCDYEQHFSSSRTEDINHISVIHSLHSENPNESVEKELIRKWIHTYCMR